MAIAVAVAVIVGIVGTVGILVWLASISDNGKHPLVKKFFDSEARMVPGYFPGDDMRGGIPKEYTDQIPGWDDTP